MVSLVNSQIEGCNVGSSAAGIGKFWKIDLDSQTYICYLYIVVNYSIPYAYLKYQLIRWSDIPI